MWDRALGNHQDREIHFPALCLCVWEGLREEIMQLPGFWRFPWHSSFFQSLQLLPVCDLLAVALVLNPRGWVCVNSESMQAFKQSLLKTRQILLQPQPPLDFTARSYGDLYSCCWNPGLSGLARDWDPAIRRHPSGVLSCINVEPPISLLLCTILHPHTFPPVSASLPLLPV